MLRPLILAAPNTKADVIGNTVVRDSPDQDGSTLRTTVNDITTHDVICDLPNWTGLAFNVKVGDAVVSVLGYVPASAIRNRRVEEMPPSAAAPFDVFVQSLVTAIVPLVKKEFEDA